MCVCVCVCVCVCGKQAGQLRGISLPDSVVRAFAHGARSSRIDPSW